MFKFINKTLKKYSKFKNIIIIGMGGSILGTEAIYDFLNLKIKKKINFYNNLDGKINFLRSLFGLIALIAIFIALRNLLIFSFKNFQRKVNYELKRSLMIVLYLPVFMRTIAMFTFLRLQLVKAILK